MELSQAILAYLILINSIAFILMGYDKFQAIRDRQRIPEKTLFAISAFGGSIGSWIGMQAFRHKTKKPKFTIGIPVLFVIVYGTLYYLMQSFHLFS